MYDTYLLCQHTPKTHDMQESTYRRTVRARAYDIARYLLPLATKTSVGQIVSARTLENQISRLAGDIHSEIQRIATLLKNSASSPRLRFAFGAAQEGFSSYWIQLGIGRATLVNTRQDLTKSTSERIESGAKSWLLRSANLQHRLNFPSNRRYLYC